MCETIIKRESQTDLQTEEDLKLFANQFLIAYKEFPIIQEVSILLMNERGVFPKVISNPCLMMTATTDVAKQQVHLQGEQGSSGDSHLQ